MSIHNSPLTGTPLGYVPNPLDLLNPAGFGHRYGKQLMENPQINKTVGDIGQAGIDLTYKTTKAYGDAIGSLPYGLDKAINFIPGLNAHHWLAGGVEGLLQPHVTSNKKSKPGDPPKTKGDGGGGGGGVLTPKQPAKVTNPLPTTLDEAYGKDGFNLNGRMIGSSVAWNGDGFVNDDPRLTAENLLSSRDKPWVSNDDLPKPESAEQQAELARALQQEANWVQQQSSKYDQQGGFTKLEDGTSTTIGPKPGFVDSMTALQAQDQSKKLVYASGKYWLQGEDGKLKAVEGSDSASARDRALAYKRGELSYGDIGGTWDLNGAKPTDTQQTPPKIDLNTPMTGEEPDLVPDMPAREEIPMKKDKNPNVAFNPLNKSITDSHNFGGAPLPGGNYWG